MTQISVIIPVYNVEHLLRRCIDCVLNQTLKDIEIICVNDGSTDGSSLILEEYKKYSNVKIINQRNAGLSVARNTGLENSNTEYVAFLDSDDFVDADFYEKLLKNIEEQKADIACASIIRENEKKKAIIVDYKKVEITENITEKFLLAHCPEHNFVWNKLYRKDFLVKNNLKFVPGMIYEDMWFTPDVLEAQGRLITVPGTYYHYWKHKNTLIKGDCDKFRADKLQGHEYLIEKCKKYNVIPLQKNELKYKKDYKLFGIPILKEFSYRATKKFYLLGIIPMLEIAKKL